MNAETRDSYGIPSRSYKFAVITLIAVLWAALHFLAPLFRDDCPKFVEKFEHAGAAYLPQSQAAHERYEQCKKGAP